MGPPTQGVKDRRAFFTKKSKLLPLGTPLAVSEEKARSRQRSLRVLDTATTAIRQGACVPNTASVSSGVLSAIQNASANSGVNFSYLLAKAAQESSFDPNAQASTSSASGLYQFTKQTWLSVVKKYGAQHGLGAYADNITLDARGRAHVSDPATKQAILDLRRNPQIASEMACELDRANMASLQKSVGGKIGGTELYLAHFLGAGGASSFLKTMQMNPSAQAAAIMPDAAAANPSVFYGANGVPKTLGQIYSHFAQKFDGTAPTNLIASAAQPAASSVAMRTTPLQSPDAPAVSSATAMTPASVAMQAARYTPMAAVTASSLFATMMLAQTDAHVHAHKASAFEG